MFNFYPPFLRCTRAVFSILIFCCSQMLAYVGIYCGPGTTNITQCESILASVLPEGTEIRRLYQRSITSGSFLESGASPVKCDLLVILCGTLLTKEDTLVKLYCDELNGDGNANILSYVEKGGRFLSIGIGSYNSAIQLLFDEQFPEHMMRKRRELGFFKGRARGPLFEPYASKPRPVQIVLSAYGVNKEDPQQTVSSESFTAYYYGGPFFDPATPDARSCKVLAYYTIPEAVEKTLYFKPADESYWSQDPRVLAAIVSMEVGAGRVVISGVNIMNPTYDRLNSEKTWTSARMLKRCLQELGLETRED